MLRKSIIKIELIHVEVSDDRYFSQIYMRSINDWTHWPFRPCCCCPQLAGSINANSTASKVKNDEGDRLVHTEKIMIVLKSKSSW